MNVIKELFSCVDRTKILKNINEGHITYKNNMKVLPDKKIYNKHPNFFDTNYLACKRGENYIFNYLIQNKYIFIVNNVILINKEKNIRNLSVVFDIDDTVMDVDGDPIKHSIELYRFCLSLGITIFFITARVYNGEDIDGSPRGENSNIFNNISLYTMEQLKRIGIVKYKAIVFRQKCDDDIFKYKLKARKTVYNQGYTTILSIGDSYWDIGDYGGKGILLTTRENKLYK